MRISDWSSGVCSSDLHQGCATTPLRIYEQPECLVRPHDCHTFLQVGVKSWFNVAAFGLGAGLPHTGEYHRRQVRSEEHTSELQSLMRISYAVFCLKKKTSYY